MKCTVFILLILVSCIAKCDQYSYGPSNIHDPQNDNFGFGLLVQHPNELDSAQDVSVGHGEEYNIVAVLQDVLTTCDDSFSVAEARINLALNRIVSDDGQSGLVEQFLAGVAMDKSHSDTFSMPLSWRLQLPRKGSMERETDGEVYLQKLTDLLLTAKEACLSLPSALSTETIFDSDKAEIGTSLVAWSREWFKRMEEQMVTFIEQCNSSEECNRLLTYVINISMFIVEKEELSDINQALEAVMDLLESDSYFGQNVRDFAAIFARLLEPKLSEPDPHWLAQGLNVEAKRQQYFHKPSAIQGKYGKNTGDLEVDTEILVHEVPKEFLSYAFASTLIQHNYRDLPEKKTKLLNLALGLAPAYVRMGGSGANFLTYDNSTTDQSFPNIKGWIYNQTFRRNALHPKLANCIDCQKELCEKHVPFHFINFTMTVTQWRFLVEFVKDLDTVLLFDLNQFKRDDSGQWDPTNARVIMDDKATRQIPVIWQLGNEPNSYKFAFDWSITPEQAARDYRSLRKELERSYPDQKHFLVGPDVTRPRKLNEEEDMFKGNTIKFLTQFLRNSSDVVDVVSWHQYYVNGRTATVSEFTSIDNMNLFVRQLDVIAHTRDKWAPSKPIWLTETANACGGGSHLLSGTFAATFLWLDKLGAAALGGISMIYRQTLFGNSYGLLDRKLAPTPNYWVSVLHKQLVGQKVLLPRVRLAPDGVRIYAHCMNKGNPLYEKGAIVVFGLNVGEDVGTLELSNDSQQNSTLYEFRLSAPLEQLRSEFVQLNDKILEVSKSGKVPILNGRQVPGGKLVLQPKTTVFYALPEAQISFC